MQMRKIGFGVAAVAALLTSSAAYAADENLKMVWGGGAQGASAYTDVYVPHIINVLQQNRLSGYTWGGVSDGTVANAEAVTDNPTHLAVGQLDILKRIQGQPIPGRSGETYEFTILAENIGPECLYAVTAEEGYETFGHILGNAWDLTVVTGGAKSGSFGTWNSLAKIYPDLADVVVVNAGGTDKIIEEVGKTPGSIGFFIMRPDPNSAIFQTIDEAGLTLVPVVDFELEEAGYEFKDLQVAYSGFFGLGDGKFHTTACTSVALITGDQANPKLAGDSRATRRLEETVKRIGAVQADALRPNTETWREMATSIKAATRERATELAKASKDAFDMIVEEGNQRLKQQSL